MPIWYNMDEVIPMQKKFLTEKQKQMYSIIKDYINEKQYSPSIRELAELAGYKSVGTAHALVQKLLEKGYITMEPGLPRTLKVVTKKH